MDYIDSDTLTRKDTARQRGASAFIRVALDAIPGGQGVSMMDLASELRTAHVNVKDRQQAYVRIGMVLSKREYKRTHIRKVDDSGYTFIVRMTEVEEEAMEFSL